MRTLFWKIFLSFWLVQALSLGILVVRFQLRERNPGHVMDVHVRPANEHALRLYGQALVERVESHPGLDLGAELKQVQSKSGMKVALADDHGKLIGGEMPAAPTDELIRRALSGREAVMMRPPDGMAVATAIDSASGKHYVVVAQFGPNPGPPRGLLPPDILMQWLIYAALSGVVCLALGYYLTRPIIKLRAATQRIAAGDLSARAEEFERQGDEIAMLTKDFNRMAGRIESLITAQRRLISDISHELRSPLARLSLALSIARKRSVPTADASLDRIEKESERLNDLIGQLLTLSRLENEVEGTQQERVQMRFLLEEVATDAEYEARNKGTEVKTEIAGDCVVYGNAHLLHSAVENVVRNAVKHTANGTDVTIALSRESAINGDTCIISVRDHGPGVPESELGNLFRPFYRLDSARGRDTGGVGLGLSITQRAIVSHGGTVRANNSESGGLVVELRIPCSAQQERRDEILAKQ
jgi:signal transduction histidine kinase